MARCALKEKNLERGLRQGCQMVYFQTKNPNLECLAMKYAGKFYDHFVYFAANSYSLLPFGKFYGHFGIFFQFWYVFPIKIWQLWFTSMFG
jgi:hypothetical protein